MKHIFNFWWFAYAGESEALPELWDRAYKLSVMYFMKYPGRTICNPVTWRHLLIEGANPARTKNIASAVRDATLRLLTQMIGEDLRMNKRYAYICLRTNLKNH